jgi:hypothetical protein
MPFDSAQDKLATGVEQAFNAEYISFFYYQILKNILPCGTLAMVNFAP